MGCEPEDLDVTTFGASLSRWMRENLDKVSDPRALRFRLVDAAGRRYSAFGDSGDGHDSDLLDIASAG